MESGVQLSDDQCCLPLLYLSFSLAFEAANNFSTFLKEEEEDE